MDIIQCLICGADGEWDVFSPFCPDCGEPVVFRRPDGIRHFHLSQPLALASYADFLPLSGIDPALSLSEGDTPLLRLPRMSRELGITLWAKNESVNPTWSFKDRGTAVVVQKAVSLGLKKIGTVSTGNMAASTAAYGARAGLKTFVLVKEDTSPEKILAASIYRPLLLAVRGDYGELFRRSYELGRKHGIYFANSVDPLRLEGYKITGYEIFNQMGSRPPEVLIVPVSAGGHFIGLARAFLDLREEGLFSHMPLLVGVQAAGCAPLAKAFAEEKKIFEKFSHPSTIAQAISNANPPGGNIVLKLIRELGGTILAVSDEEMLEAQRMLAEKEGLFCLPDSATVLAGLIKLLDMIPLRTSDQVVLVITGTGLKSLPVLDSSSEATTRVELGELGDTLAAFLEEP
jgi:threonine synthase